MNSQVNLNYILKSNA